MKIQQEKAIVAMLNICVENLCATRIMFDQISELCYPDDEVKRLAHGLLVRQKVEAARIKMIERIYAEEGSINLDDILDTSK